jgi:4-amino-4-deoxychorismate lyase
MLFINNRPMRIEQKLWACFHGHSVFTTFRSKHKEILLWPLHWHRLIAHAKFFDFFIPSEQEVLYRLKKEIKKGDRKFRVILSDKHYAITSEAYEPPASVIYSGVKVHYSGITTHKTLGHYKTGNSLPYKLAYAEAIKNQAFEGLLLDSDGFLVDGSRTSLILIKDQTIYSLTGGLDGCMRKALNLWAKDQGLKCEDIKLKPQDLNGSLLLANSLLGIIPVDRIKCDLALTVVEQFRMDKP